MHFTQNLRIKLVDRKGKEVVVELLYLVSHGYILIITRSGGKTTYNSDIDLYDVGLYGFLRNPPDKQL